MTNCDCPSSVPKRCGAVVSLLSKLPYRCGATCFLYLSIFLKFLRQLSSCFLVKVSLFALYFSLQWALMTHLDPASSLANLIYIGYSADPSSAFRITRRRRLDRKRQQSQRNVFQCFVFGPRNAGKSALLNSLIGR